MAGHRQKPGLGRYGLLRAVFGDGDGCVDLALLGNIDKGQDHTVDLAIRCQAWLDAPPKPAGRLAFHIPLGHRSTRCHQGRIGQQARISGQRKHLGQGPAHVALAQAKQRADCGGEEPDVQIAVQRKRADARGVQDIAQRRRHRLICEHRRGGRSFGHDVLYQLNPDRQRAPAPFDRIRRCTAPILIRPQPRSSARPA